MPRIVVPRWSLWLVEKLTFKHETPAKVDAMTMARALLELDWTEVMCGVDGGRPLLLPDVLAIPA